MLGCVTHHTHFPRYHYFKPSASVLKWAFFLCSFSYTNSRNEYIREISPINSVFGAEYHVLHIKLQFPSFTQKMLKNSANRIAREKSFKITPNSSLVWFIQHFIIACHHLYLHQLLPPFIIFLSKKISVFQRFVEIYYLIHSQS